MKSIEVLKNDVSRNFEVHIDAKVAAYISRLEEAVSSEILQKYKDDPDLTVNTRVTGINSTDITSIMTELNKERPEITRAVLAKAVQAGYTVVEKNVSEGRYNVAGKYEHVISRITYTVRF